MEAADFTACLCIVAVRVCAVKTDFVYFVQVFAARVTNINIVIFSHHKRTTSVQVSGTKYCSVRFLNTPATSNRTNRAIQPSPASDVSPEAVKYSAEGCYQVANVCHFRNRKFCPRVFVSKIIT